MKRKLLISQTLENTFLFVNGYALRTTKFNKLSKELKFRQTLEIVTTQLFNYTDTIYYTTSVQIHNQLENM